jgi:hypothetical protein
MDIEDKLAEARRHVQNAETRARLTTSPDAKRRWQQLAVEWRTTLTSLEARLGRRQEDDSITSN